MSCPLTLASIEQQLCGKTPGFKGKIYIEYEHRVKTITYDPETATDHTVSADIVMGTALGEGIDEDGIFKEFPVSTVPGKGTLNSPLNGDEDSSQYNHEAVFFLPGVSTEKSHALKGVKGVPLVIVTEDSDGNMQIIGDVDNGCYMRAEEVNEEGSRGYNLTITWRSNMPLLFYTGAITV